MYQSRSFSASSRMRVNSSSTTALSGAMPSVAGLPHFDSGGIDPAFVSLSRLQHLTDILDRYLRLPNDFRSFALFFAALMLVFAGAMLQVLLSAQILQARVEQRHLKQELALIQQQNGDIVWQIARETNMAQLQARVLERGYQPLDAREYLVVAPEPVAAAAVFEAAPTASTAPVATAAPALVAGTAPSRQAPAWEEFFTFRWHTSQEGPLPQAASIPTQGDDSVADQWLRWWQQTLNHRSAPAPLGQP